MAELLRDMLVKPIDRSIDGVIKADDDASLRVELEEYVITAEIGQRLEQFLSAYNNYDTANGVWISGFFGSGKSHLLKMLALLLENKSVDGTDAWELFKDKLEREPMLRGALEKAISIPSRSILFNIDQKADVIAKTDIDALLSVFQKVFDDMCGFYGKQPHIARFERDLLERGQFSDFQDAFEAIAGKDWQRGREQALLEGQNIAQAYAQASGTDIAHAADIVKKYREDTRVSIEDFANSVNSWIERQEKGFRLNFFVDEVGQYIAENIKLMTNLQTIAESLNTKCKGQAWIIVTAQQAITEVVGDMSARQEHDFSKIQARFANRMPLNSADVAEVIQRRLLAKTDQAQITLGNLFDREENNLDTIFNFADGRQLKNFADQKHFIATYPFPPYQYTLFQSALRGLSEHNAFEGKHSSVGERSMLGVFQEVGKALAEKPVGYFSSFDMMFEGIRSVLKSASQQSIQIAEKNLDDEFAVRVLKALFLVKYVKDFESTARNLSVLLLTDIGADSTTERRLLEEALSRLERENYIQRNGDKFEFLTNEEKDIEAEIKDIDIDPSETEKLLESLFFDTVLKPRKIKHQQTGQEYPFSRKIDRHLLGKEYELGVDLVSPASAGEHSPEGIKMESLSREDLCLLPEADLRFTRDLSLYEKTNKFVRQARSGSDQPSRSRIVEEKGAQNNRRRADLEQRLRKLITEAAIFVRGEELDIGGEDPQERVFKAFQKLIDTVYPNLPMLRNHQYSEADIAAAATRDPSLFGSEDDGITEAERDILNHIQSQGKSGVKTSVDKLCEKFSKKPYGWPDVATLTILAGLNAKGKLEARSDGTALEGQELAKALNNKRQLSNLLLTPQIEFTTAQTRKAKDLYKDFFDKPANGSDAKSLAADWVKSLDERAREVRKILSESSQYPFVKALEPFADNLEAYASKPAAWVMTDLPKHEDALLDAKDHIYDPIRTFLGGEQKKIYDDVREFVRTQEANFSQLATQEASRLTDALDDPDCFKGSTIQDLKTDFYETKSKLEKKVLEERKALEAAIDEASSKLAQSDALQALDEAERKMLLAKLDGHRETNSNHIANLRLKATELRTGILQNLLLEADQLANPAPTSDPVTANDGAGSGFISAPKDAVVNASDLLKWDKLYLQTDEDVDAYTTALREKLSAEVRAGKKVIV